MSDAGLTHGAFYSHFQDKADLARQALVQALAENRRAWISEPQPESWPKRLARLAKRYLTPEHRRNLSDSCALAALCSDAARSGEDFRDTFEQEFLKSLSAVCGNDFDSASRQQADEALAFLSLMIGSISLSRAVRSRALADRLLEAGQAAAANLPNFEETTNDTGETNAGF